MVYTFRSIGGQEVSPMHRRETSTIDQKRLLIRDYVRGAIAMAELCRRYGSSRPTGYKRI